MNLNLLKSTIQRGNLTVVGTVSTSNHGNSNQWNTAYTLVQNNSASWEESADILPTVTNYLSTNNISLSALTITNAFSGINSLTITGNISGNNLRTSFNQGSATGLYSFAVGSGRAFGTASHAEGNGTLATSTGAHAEGTGTVASNTGAHAEGYNTVASGNGSHAEGWLTTATDTGSHAEGFNTVASNDGAHAEGRSTTASGLYSHAEGQFTTAFGIASHAEGNRTNASNSYGHAEGSETTASGVASHAEGLSAVASGQGSHAEGTNTTALAYASHAEGYQTLIGRAGNYEYVLYDEISTTLTFSSSLSSTINKVVAGNILNGYDETNLGGYFSSEVESVNSASSTITFVGDIFGFGGYSDGSATGYVILPDGDFSHVEGYSTIASGSACHAGGYGATALQNYTYAWSDGNLGTRQNISTTRTGQYMVSASGGMFIPGRVGIGTDSIANALTVVGNISATGTGIFNTIALSSVTFTGETKTSTTSVTATDTYIKVIANGQTKYLRLFDII